MTTAPHGASCAGFPFAPGVFRGLFSVCLICYFNAPIRRFNSGRCPYIATALRALCALFVGVWRGVAPCAVACRLRCQLAAALLPLWPCRWLAPARWRGLGGWWCGPLHAGQGFRGWRTSLPKSLILPQNHSRLQNSVYKRGVSLAYFPRIDGKSCKSRSVSAHFTSKSLAAMYFCWSCSGVKPSICGWFGVKTISCLSTMP